MTGVDAQPPSAGRFEAVFFDLGGTLFQHLPVTHTEDNLLRGVVELERPSVSPDEFVARYRTYRQRVEEESLDHRFFLHRNLVAKAFERTLEEFGIRDEGAVTRFCDRQRDSVIRHLEPREDARETLRSLRARQCFTAIVSNIDDDYIVPLLQRTGFESEVDFWISSERARSCKPHPRIMHIALEASGIDAAKTLFVGDSQIHDVQGATGLGMATALLIVDHVDSILTEADLTIERLSDLLSIV